MKLRFTILILAIVQFCSAQTTSDFEGFTLAPDSFLNGSDGSMGFSDGNIRLLNDYNSEWDSWSGWAISSFTDTTTPGFTNQYSSISGIGAEGSAAYAVSFVSGVSLLHTTDAAEGGTVEGFYINNATYAYLSMRDGDAFAKKFGGEDGNDPDFFYLSIKEYGDRNVNNDSLIVYLADYRSDDNTEDYIIDEWTYVDLTRFENVDTLSFQLYSSDNGMFGMNTPAYFCIDNFTTTDMKLTAVEDVEKSKVTVYPNPTSGLIHCTGTGYLSSYALYDIYGNLLETAQIESNDFELDISARPSGNYLLITHDKDGRPSSQRIIRL